MIKFILEFLFILLVFGLWGIACYRNGYLDGKEDNKKEGVKQ